MQLYQYFQTKIRKVATWSDLPDAVINNQEVVFVLEDSGVWPFNKDSGFYYSTGSEWVLDKNTNGLVDLYTDQTINGLKTFNADLHCNNSLTVDGALFGEYYNANLNAHIDNNGVISGYQFVGDGSYLTNIYTSQYAERAHYAQECYSTQYAQEAQNSSYADSASQAGALYDGNIMLNAYTIYSNADYWWAGTQNFWKDNAGFMSYDEQTYFDNRGFFTSGCLTLGSTTVSETQLQALLALI